MLIFLLYRLSFPDLKLKVEQSNLSDIAKKLFGEENTLNITSSKTTPNPLLLFCTKSNINEGFGQTIANFSNLVFCDDTKYIQTDVGICHTQNPVMLWNQDQLSVQNLEGKLEENLRNTEHLFILSLDKFENPSSFKV